MDIGAGDQFKPEFLAISPNNKIPAIVDPDGPDGKPISLFESGAILLYLAARPGASCPLTRAASTDVLQWLMFQMGSVGPMLGQAHHFRIYAPEKIGYAIDRYSNEAKRLYGVMNKRLAKSRYIAGRRVHDRRHRDLPVAALVEEPGHRLDRLPAPEGWFDEIAARPAVQRGVEVLAGLRKPFRPTTGRERAVRREAVPAALSRRAGFSRARRSRADPTAAPRASSAFSAPRRRSC